MSEVFYVNEQYYIDCYKNWRCNDKCLFQVQLTVYKERVCASDNEGHGEADQKMEWYAEYAFPVEYGKGQAVDDRSSKPYEHRDHCVIKAVVNDYHRCEYKSAKTYGKENIAECIFHSELLIIEKAPVAGREVIYCT